MSSCSLSSSSSSSSSLLDSTTSSILGASAWNLEKSNRPVEGRPIISRRNSSTKTEHQNEDENENRHHHLLQPRRYQSPNIQDADLSKPDIVEVKTDKTEKTELESAVLLDCLSINSLWSHLPPTNLRRLVDSFEKCRYCNHEIVFTKGEEAKYLYILYSGEVSRKESGEAIEPGQEDEGDGKYVTLGELAVLTGGTYQQSVLVTSPTCILFCLDRASFHGALKPPLETTSEECLHLLKNAIPPSMLEHFTEHVLQKLCSNLSPYYFTKNDVLVKKGTRLDSLVIIAKGLVVSTEVTMGGRVYEDQSFGPGEDKTSFGWQSVLTNSDEPSFQGTVVAQTDGVALLLSQSAFRNALGEKGIHASSLHHLAARRLARNQLKQIPVFRDSDLDDGQVEGLLDLMHHCEYTSDSPSSSEQQQSESKDQMTIFKAGQKVEAAMYFVREGGVTLLLNKGESKEVIQAGGYFGEGNMLRDQNKDGQKHYVIRSPMTAVAHAPHTILDVLYLEECRGIVNTKILGLGNKDTVGSGSADTSIQLADLDRHTLLGTGCFGQVWLASIDEIKANPSFEEKKSSSVTDEKGRRIVALKVQAKYQLVQAEKADRVVAERNILASLHSPFILQLFHAFQDESRLYMITSLLQGGELESVIPEDGLSENAARFYAAGILEGLTYMHRRHIIHRDIKPGNILLNEKGYPVIIDFGFAKYVPDKSYTFCGSPFFIAPEIIRFKGHDKACDIWAWAVLTYKMVTGKYPFYKKGIDEMMLYKRICKGTFEIDGQMSVEFRMLLVSVLYPDPEKRLGAGMNGGRDILKSPWFSNLSNNSTFDIVKLRRQEMPAPWVPNLKDSMDASSFHPNVSGADEDLMNENFPAIFEKDQQIFDSFGPQINML